MDKDQLICICEDVTAGEIIDAIRQHGCIETVKRCTRACVTCFGCEMEIEELFEQYGSEGASVAGSTGAVPVAAGASRRF